MYLIFGGHHIYMYIYIYIYMCWVISGFASFMPTTKAKVLQDKPLRVLDARTTAEQPTEFRLPKTNMETKKGPYKDYSPSKRELYGFPCSFGGV